MSIIDEVTQNEVIQEFVVRVRVTTDSRDPKFLRNVLDGVAATFDTTRYKFDGGQVEVTQVYAK